MSDIKACSIEVARNFLRGSVRFQQEDDGKFYCVECGSKRDFVGQKVDHSDSCPATVLPQVRVLLEELFERVQAGRQTEEADASRAGLTL